MFYSELILARKGPLGKIWLAAHFDKKLTKKQIFSTDISSSVESVLNPTNPLALRVSGHLMLGIVRIYSRKMKYLVTDCADAMWKIDLAFRPKNVDIDPTIAQIIDDARHFGNVSIDNEFPELENTAFPQDLLSGYDYPRLDTSRFSDHSFRNDGSYHEYSMDAESPLVLNKARPSGSSSRRSVVSDIDLMREQRSLSMGSQQRNRISLSTARPYGSSMGGDIDEEVPVLDENFGGDYMSFDDSYLARPSTGGGLLEFGTQDQELLPDNNIDYYMPMDEEKGADEAEVVSGRKSARGSLRVQQAAAAQRQREEEELQQQESEDEDEAEKEGEGEGAATAAGGGGAAQAKKQRKKKRVLVCV